MTPGRRPQSIPFAIERFCSENGWGIIQPPPSRGIRQSYERHGTRQHTAVQSSPGINALKFHRVLTPDDATNTFVGLAECLGFSKSGDRSAIGNTASFLQARDRRTTTLWDSIESQRTIRNVVKSKYMRNNICFVLVCALYSRRTIVYCQAARQEHLHLGNYHTAHYTPPTGIGRHRRFRPVRTALGN